MASLVFPSTGMQVLSSLIHFLGVSILTHCLSRRLVAEELTSFQGLSQISWPRLCILLVFLDSWLFLFSSGILIFGVGLELGHAICSSAIYLCIGFYSTSKILIYAFLIEKVHIVWSPSTGMRRFQSRVYTICFITVALYAVIIALLLIGRVHYFRDDGVCVVGLKPFSSIPLLTYDLYVNVFLTSLFLWPLFKSNHANPRVRKVATRTLIAAGIALTTSTVNMLVLTIVRGHELGWVCLGSCGADVIFNALALFWVTGGSGSRTTISSLGAVKAIPDVNQHPIDITGRPGVLGCDSSPSHVHLSHRHLSHVSMYDNMPQPPKSKIWFMNGAARDRESGLVLEMENHSATRPKQPSVLKAVTGFFRKEPAPATELQITVTTEFDLDNDNSVKVSENSD